MLPRRFLGLRINCARCHDHPFDRWSQQDYLAFVKVFDQVRHDLSPEMRREIAARLQVRRERVANGEAVGPPMPRITEVYVATSIDSEEQTDAADEHIHEIRAKALGGDFIAFEDQDRRVGFTDWLVDKDNPYFAKNLVNRVWAHYFGRGLVEPLDGLSSHLHEAAYPELLDELAQSFIDSGYNIKQLETLLLNSQAWQLSSVPNASNGDDQTYFSRAYVRLPLPEVVVDMWHAGTGIHYDLGDATLRGLHAVEVGPDRLPGDRWNEFYALFGRVKRSETCDCSAKGRPSIRQTLALMSDSRMLSDISGGRLNQLMESEQADEAIIEELYLRTVSRYPTPDESAMLTEALASTQIASPLGTRSCGAC